MAKEHLVAFNVTPDTPPVRWLASLSDGRTVIQDDRPNAPAAWHRLREFLVANPGLAITGLRLQGVKGKELTVLSHQPGYFFGFKGQAIVGGPQQHYVGIGYYDGNSVIINWLALPHFNHQFSEQRSKERAGFMLIENTEDGG